ncbi:unnamed protein product, partial [Arabidopsis halleri]
DIETCGGDSSPSSISPTVTVLRAFDSDRHSHLHYMSSHDNNDDLVDKKVQGEEEVQVQTSVGKKRTETQRSSSDLPSNPRKKLAQSSDIRQYFVPKDDDKESTNRTRNDIRRCELFKAYQETSE